MVVSVKKNISKITVIKTLQGSVAI